MYSLEDLRSTRYINWNPIMLDILRLLVEKHLCYHKDPNLNSCRMTGPTRKLSFRPLIGWWWPKPTTRLPWGAKGLLAFYDSSSPIFPRWAVVDIRMSEKSCRRPGLDWHAERRFIDESVHKLYTSPRQTLSRSSKMFLSDSHQAEMH